MVVNFVAHMDMLGFKSAVMSDFDEAWRALGSLRVAIDEALQGKLTFVSPPDYLSKWVRYDLFSDSVVLYTAHDSDEELLAIVTATSALLVRSLTECVPLRGGIAHGRYQRSGDKSNALVMGESLVKACQIGDAAQWMGIVVEEEIARRLQKTVLKDYAVPWDISKCGDTCLVLNWPKACSNCFVKKPPIPVKEWYQPFTSLWGPYCKLTPYVKRKWRNTVRFINAHLPS